MTEEKAQEYLDRLNAHNKKEENLWKEHRQTLKEIDSLLDTWRASKLQPTVGEATKLDSLAKLAKSQWEELKALPNEWLNIYKDLEKEEIP